MKKMSAILIIALCLLFLVLPVIAAQDGQGAHAGITAGAAGDNGQSHGEKNGIGRAEGNNTSATPAYGLSPGDQRNAKDGNGNNPADSPRTDSLLPGPDNQSGKDHEAPVRNTSRVPPGWEKNPNLVRDSVHALLAMENRTGGIGPQVSAIAREFNNSANASQQYEDRIQNRDALSRFFFGSDRQAATGLANLTAQNQARISEIENLMKTTTLDADTRAQMEEQIQVLQQKVTFDQQLAAQAEQDRGIFGRFG